MSDTSTRLERLAVEYRVLPLRRFLVDNVYWAWVSFWFAVLPPLMALERVPFMAGCRGYFEWRDANEFPAIQRWHSFRWRQWRNAALKERGA